MFSSGRWWRSARTRSMAGAKKKWERSVMLLLVVKWLKRHMSPALSWIRSQIFVYTLPWSFPFLCSVFPSAHGEAVYARLPSGENAELLREGGGAQPGGTAAAVQRLQSLRVHQQGSDPHEGGEMLQPASLIGQETFDLSHTPVRMSENTPCSLARRQTTPPLYLHLVGKKSHLKLSCCTN